MTVAEVESYLGWSNQKVRRHIGKDLISAGTGYPTLIDRVSVERVRNGALAKLGIDDPHDHLLEDLVRLEAEVARLDSDNARLRRAINEMSTASEATSRAIRALTGADGSGA